MWISKGECVELSHHLGQGVDNLRAQPCPLVPRDGCPTGLDSSTRHSAWGQHHSRLYPTGRSQ